MCTVAIEHCSLRLPSLPLPSHPVRSWNHVSRDVPITGRKAAAINVLSVQARRRGGGAQDGGAQDGDAKRRRRGG